MRVGWALLLCACGGAKTTLPVEAQEGDLIVVVPTIDGVIAPELRRFAPGEPLEVKSDPDTPIFTYRFSPNDFVNPDGTPLSANYLSEIVVVARGGRAGRENSSGQCGRCLVPSFHAPQLVHAGDRCVLPAFSPGAVWRKSGDTYACKGAPNSTLCTGGDAADAMEIEEVRRAVVLEWPGACACEPASGPVSLDRLELQGVTPEVAPWPTVTWSGNDTHLAGFSSRVAVIHDLNTGATEVTPLALEATVEHSVALRNGDFLLAAEGFNTGSIEENVYYRVPVMNGRAGAPQRVDRNPPALPVRMKYLEGARDFPLYLMGSVRSGTGLEPSIFACTDNTLACQRLDLQVCPNQGVVYNVADMYVVPGGAGIGFGSNAIFTKAPNPGGEPLVTDRWYCNQFQDGIQSANGRVQINYFTSMAVLGDRAFVCGVTRAERCQPDNAVVITATIGAAAGERPQPKWQVAYEGPDWTRCGQFHTAGDQVRLHVTGGRMLSFDAAGNLTESTVSDTYGSISGFSGFTSVPHGTLIHSSENRTLWTNTVDPPRLVYGPENVAGADFRALLALPDATFLAFGHPRGVLRLSSDGTDVAQTLLEDSSGVLGQRQIWSAARNSATEQVLVGGSDGFLGWVTLGSSLEVQPLPNTGGQSGRGILGLTEVTPGRFVAIAQGAQVLAIDAEGISELEVPFDDPATESVEHTPTATPNSCTNQIPRLDTFRAISGGHGVAWIAGIEGTLFRVIGHRVERIASPGDATFAAVDALCPDQVRVAGRERSVDLGGIERLRLSMRRVRPVADDETFTGQRELAVDVDAASEIESTQVHSLLTGTPRALLRDLGRTNRGETYALVLVGGWVHRLKTNDPLRYRRVPFDPVTAVQGPDGKVLFASGALLVLGVPR